MAVPLLLVGAIYAFLTVWSAEAIGIGLLIAGFVGLALAFSKYAR